MEGAETVAMINSDGDGNDSDGNQPTHVIIDSCAESARMLTAHAEPIVVPRCRIDAPWTPEHADLMPVYESIFRRMQSLGMDWVYHFPRLYLIDFRPLREALDRKGKAEWEDYSPSEALAKETEDKRRDEEIAQFRAALEEDRNQAIENARHQPAPAPVQAYHHVYGHWPRGWPPRIDDADSISD